MKANAALASLALAVSFVSCQQAQTIFDQLNPLNDGVTQNLSDEVTELQSMRQQLSNSWGDIEGRVTTVENDIDNFSPNAPAVAGVDLSPLADDILQGAAVNAAEAGSVQDTTADIEGLYDGTSAETQSEIMRVQAEGKRIMAELHTGLPTSLQDLVGQATTTTASALLIQKKAEQMAPVASQNVLMTDEQKTDYEKDMKVLESEVTKLNQLADKISRESGGMTDRMTRAMTTFQGKVGAFRADS